MSVQGNKILLKEDLFAFRKRSTLKKKCPVLTETQSTIGPRLVAPQGKEGVNIFCTDFPLENLEILQ